MSKYDPRDSEFEERVRQSFARQEFMATLGAELEDVRPGKVEIALPFREELTQQHDYLHAAAVTAIADSACGYAALTLTEPGHEVLSVEFKVNMMEPGAGDRFLASAEVLRPGRTLTVCSAKVFAFERGEQTTIASMQATMIAVATDA